MYTHTYILYYGVAARVEHTNPSVENQLRVKHLATRRQPPPPAHPII